MERALIMMPRCSVRCNLRWSFSVVSSFWTSLWALVYLPLSKLYFTITACQVAQSYRNVFLCLFVGSHRGIYIDAEETKLRCPSYASQKNSILADIVIVEVCFDSCLFVLLISPKEAYLMPEQHKQDIASIQPAFNRPMSHRPL